MEGKWERGKGKLMNPTCHEPAIVYIVQQGFEPPEKRIWLGTNEIVDVAHKCARLIIKSLVTPCNFKVRLVCAPRHARKPLDIALQEKKLY